MARHFLASITLLVEIKGNKWRAEGLDPSGNVKTQWLPIHEEVIFTIKDKNNPDIQVAFLGKVIPT